MPLVATSALPSFERLRARGVDVLSQERARHQDIRELHIGLLNMMPDAALEATERQFLRLIGACNRIVQFHVHPFSVPGIERRGEARRHVERYYESFAAIQRDGLDALIISGANPANPDLRREGFWDSLVGVMDWARAETCSTVYSCLATHAALAHYYGVERVRLPRKRWGVYSHRITGSGHPLLADVNTRFDGPHSHVYDLSREQFEDAGQSVLVHSEEAGVYMAVSEDKFRSVYFQGHPEYDTNSLLKEFKREIARLVRGEREDFPACPEHYFPASAQALIEAFRERLEGALRAGDPPPSLPEEALRPLVDNTWTDTGKGLFNNWLGLVYQLTHKDRRTPFMEGIDPQDPLGMR